MKTLKYFIVASAGVLCMSQAAADFDPTAYPAYETCALCHDLFGNSTRDKFPKLAGQRPAYLEAQIGAFLSGDRTNDGGQMAAIVTELHAEDIAVVVEWFSTQDAPPPAPLPAGNTGELLYTELGCGGCHDDPERADVPFLTAQHSAYLFKQMTDFRDGRRTFPEVAMMHQDILAIPDADLENIADFLAAQERVQ